MGRVVQLYAGCILLTIVVDPDTPTHTDLTPMTLERFRTAVEVGDLLPSTPATAHAYAKLVLGMFADGLATPAFDDALRVAAGS
jgi:hypothetical protein